MLQFTTLSILMALSGLVPSQSTPIFALENQPIVEEVKAASKKISELSKRNNHDLSEVEVKEYVNEYFTETPILAKVAFCESTLRHYGKDGYVLRGMVDNRDVGLMQINEGYHLETAKKLGYDIYTMEGNMEYAKLLYEKFGLSPWNASSKCWLKHAQLAMK